MRIVSALASSRKGVGVAKTQYMYLLLDLDLDLIHVDLGIVLAFQVMEINRRYFNRDF